MNIKNINKKIAIVLTGTFILMNSPYVNKNINNSYAETVEVSNKDDNYSYSINLDYYNVLTEEEKVLYNNAVDKILNHDDLIYISDDIKVTRKILNAIYFSEYGNYIHSHFSNVDGKYKVFYRYDKDEINMMTTELNDMFNKIISSLITPDMNDLDKIIILYRYVVDNYQYDVKWYKKNYTVTSPKDNSKTLVRQPLHHFMKEKKGVCQGYAYFLDYALNKLGIETYLIEGYNKKERHIWNMVSINGEYYYLDPTIEHTFNTTLDKFLISTKELKDNKYKIIYDKFLSKDLSVECNSDDFIFLRNYDSIEYLGNHNYKLTKNKETYYFNSESLELTDEIITNNIK